MFEVRSNGPHLGVKKGDIIKVKKYQRVDKYK